MDPETAPVKTTLPRPSKLPVSASRSSQLPLPKRSQASESINGSTAVSKAPPTSEKRPIPSLRTSRSSNLKAPSGVTTKHNTAGLSNGSIPSLRASSNSRLSNVNKPSQRTHTKAPATATTSALESAENHDALSPLDSFRSASPQGYSDDSPTEQRVPESPVVATEAPTKRKASRPSLSDRTIDSLQSVPTTPKDRRRSSFFSPRNGAMGPPPRPASSLSRNGSNGGSRPGTSDGSFGQSATRPPPLPSKRFPASAQPATRSFGFNPRRSTSMASTALKLDAATSVPASPRSPSKSKTIAARPSKSRPSLQAALVPPTESTPPKVNSSSSALREQIAAAKAATRKEKSLSNSSRDIAGKGDHVQSLATAQDPFNLAPKDGKHVLRNRINAARMDGKLNIAALDLTDIPSEVLTMYDPEAMAGSNVSWMEVVDLTRFIAADNKIAQIENDVFPDMSRDEIESDDQAKGNQFGGLEMLDLHGNILRSLPSGVRRLERLTSLNLSHNKLEIDVLDTVSQIPLLRDLKLGHNDLAGHLPSILCELQRLEVLDLQANRLLGLPEALRELTNMRVLNVANNQLTTLPMKALESLTELDASSNALIGSLFPATGGDIKHSHLQTLNIANNSLAALAFDRLDLPRLRDLNVTNNHLTSLPDLSDWTELLTLMAGDNKLDKLPDGFTNLRKLKNVNLTGNDIRLIDAEVAKMDTLDSLILAANPLRDKKYLTMSAADIKHDLRSRLSPTAAASDDEEAFEDARDDFTPPSSTSKQKPKSPWTLLPQSRLDLSAQSHTDALNNPLGTFLQSHTVLHLTLASNTLTCFPPALWLATNLTSLDLSNNRLAPDYLTADLELPALQDLSLSRCGIASLETLVDQLAAPKLQSLTLTANRLSGPVPALRTTYPFLRTLLAADNAFDSVTPEALKGLSAVDLSGNALAALPAEIGLLWEEGLRSLEVGRNAFRVPGWRVLEKGTEATMEWLRGRIP